MYKFVRNFKQQKPTNKPFDDAFSANSSIANNENVNHNNNKNIRNEQINQEESPNYDATTTNVPTSVINLNDRSTKLNLNRNELTLQLPLASQERRSLSQQTNRNTQSNKSNIYLFFFA